LRGGREVIGEFEDMTIIRSARTLLCASAAVLSLGLAACNSQEGVTAKDASVEDVAKAIAKSDVALSPGRWETSVSMGGKALPVPGADKDAMATCLTKADIDNMDEQMMQMPMDTCKYDSFTMAGGKIEGAMSCNPPEGQGAAMKMTMAGTYTPESYDMEMTTHMTMGGKSQTTKMQVASRRVGECNGTELQAPKTT
jgi:predicted small secreted protein